MWGGHEEAEAQWSLGVAVKFAELGGASSCAWVERQEHSSASSAFYWTLSTSAVKNKGNNQTHWWITNVQAELQDAFPATEAGNQEHTHHRLPQPVCWGGRRDREMRDCSSVGKWGFVGGSCAHPHAWWACVGRTGRKHGWTGGWIEELQNSRELQCSYASCYQCTDSFIFIGPGLRAHRRTHGKQRVAFLWWKSQFNVDNTFLFQPLFRVKSGVISALQPDILQVYIAYINMYSAHLGTVWELWFLDTGNTKFHQTVLWLPQCSPKNESMRTGYSVHDARYKRSHVWKPTWEFKAHVICWFSCINMKFLHFSHGNAIFAAN